MPEDLLITHHCRQFIAVWSELRAVEEKGTLLKLMTSESDMDRILTCIGQIRDIVTEFQMVVQFQAHDKINVRVLSNFRCGALTCCVCSLILGDR